MIALAPTGPPNSYSSSDSNAVATFFLLGRPRLAGGEVADPFAGFFSRICEVEGDASVEDSPVGAKDLRPRVLRRPGVSTKPGYSAFLQRQLVNHDALLLFCFGSFAGERGAKATS